MIYFLREFEAVLLKISGLMDRVCHHGNIGKPNVLFDFQALPVSQKSIGSVQEDISIMAWKVCGLHRPCSAGPLPAVMLLPGIKLCVMDG